ncbi:MAG TPA: XRE family transcriptional regulator [Lactococcus garvieae]|uniref:helix-turn-helix domain-containing protein n=1 Tax=Lactococcus garvieae TaxID=1363 RepID=UPI000EDDC3F5|nr:helix-turn-helix transcriptional regulator [Lactococcus garvieae]HCS85639.1 XRE family transcriptional regulator [Lactococcus garvieae]
MQQNSLKGWREKEGLSKELLASKLNLTVSELGDLEKDSSRISKKKLERILSLFNITYDEIILGKTENH